VKFGNSQEITFPTAGAMHNVRYSNAWIRMEDETIDNVRISIQSGDGELPDNDGNPRDPVEYGWKKAQSVPLEFNA